MGGDCTGLAGRKQAPVPVYAFFKDTVSLDKYDDSGVITGS
jgi:hypothetical protein